MRTCARNVLAGTGMIMLAGLAAGIALAAPGRTRTGPTPLVYRVAAGRHTSRLTLQRAGNSLELLDGARVVRARPLASVSRVLVQGGSGRTNDTLTVDLRHGFFAVPVRYDGGRGGFDRLAVRSGGRSSPVYSPTGRGAGTVTLGRLRIAFSNLEPVTMTSNGGTLTINDPTSNDFLSLQDDNTPNDGVNVVVGFGGFETVTLSGYDTVVLEGNSDNEVLQSNGPDPADPDGAGPEAALTQVTIHGDDGDDDLVVLDPIAATIASTLNGGNGNDTLDVKSDLAAIQGPVTLDGGANASTSTTGGSATCQTTVVANTVDGDVAEFSDGNSGTAATYTVGFPSSLQRSTGFGGATIANAETFHLVGSNFADTYNVAATGAGTNEQVYAGTATNTATIAGTGASSYFLFAGGQGSDQITLQHTGASSVSDLNGGLGNGNDTLTVTADGGGSGVNILGGGGADTANLLGSAPGSVVNVALLPGPGDVYHESAGQQGTICSDSTPTAVTLRSFSAVQRAHSVLVRWRTASEASLLGFNVYREQNGKRVKLNRSLVTAVFGGTTQGRAYRWLDRTAPRTGAWRYRLQTVALDGTRSWSASAVPTRS